jgi:hypothetical protein
VEIAQDLHTDGDDAITRKRNKPQLVSGRFDIPDEGFDIRMVIKSRVGMIKERDSYSDSYPPMPFIIDQFSVYQVGEGYRFYSRDLGLDVRAGVSSQQTEILMSQSKTGAYTLSVDGACVATGKGPIVQRGSYRLYSNGADRRWDGTITSFEIVNSGGDTHSIAVK